MRLVIDHGIAGVAYFHARDLSDRFPGLVGELDQARCEALARHVVTVADLATVRAAFAGFGWPWAVLKGPVLAEVAYRRPDLRSYNDLDLLVHPRGFGEALERLEGMGAELLDRNWPLIAASARAQLTVVVAGRTAVDLHWHPINEANVRRAFRWDVTAMLARVRPLAVGGAEVPALDPADSLVHLCAHAALSGGHRLVWLKDIERQWATDGVALEKVLERAQPSGLRPLVELMVRRAESIGGPRLPVTAPWTRLLRIAGFGRFRTDAGWLGDGETLMASTRSTFAASGRALSAALVEGRLGPCVRRLPAGGRVLPEPPSPAALHRTGGGPSERRAYLTSVAGTVR